MKKSRISALECLFEILALLQAGTICLVSPVKISECSNKNSKRSSVLKKSRISDSYCSKQKFEIPALLRWHYMPSFSMNDRIRTEGGVALPKSVISAIPLQFLDPKQKFEIPPLHWHYMSISPVFRMSNRIAGSSVLKKSQISALEF